MAAFMCGDSAERRMSCLIIQSSQVSLQTLMFAQQSLHTGQVTTKVIRGHELLLLLDPADGLIHIPVVRVKTHSRSLSSMRQSNNMTHECISSPPVCLMFTC